MEESQIQGFCASLHSGRNDSCCGGLGGDFVEEEEEATGEECGGGEGEDPG